MSSGATFTEVRLGIKLGGYIHPVRWQIVDTRQVALLLILLVLSTMDKAMPSLALKVINY
tara:strand:- start:325 stop:504 length:180 start_codon:yes stop_codon:yes gene_type:complete